jgi:hypothetical protein
MIITRAYATILAVSFSPIADAENPDSLVVQMEADR